MYSKYILSIICTFLFLTDAKYIEIYEDFQILNNTNKSNVTSKIFLNNNQHCVNINKNWINKISYINTNYNLIRIYSDYNCTSSSVIIKGKHDLYGDYVRNYYNDNIKSIRLIKKN